VQVQAQVQAMARVQAQPGVWVLPQVA